MKKTLLTALALLLAGCHAPVGSQVRATLAVQPLPTAQAAPADAARLIERASHTVPQQVPAEQLRHVLDTGYEFVEHWSIGNGFAGIGTLTYLGQGYVGRRFHYKVPEARYLVINYINGPSTFHDAGGGTGYIDSVLYAFIDGNMFVGAEVLGAQGVAAGNGVGYATSRTTPINLIFGFTQDVVIELPDGVTVGGYTATADFLHNELPK